MNRTAWPLFAIAALCITGIVVLTLAGNPVPEVLTNVAVAALAAAAGITIPSTNPASGVTTQHVPPPPPVPPEVIPVAHPEPAPAPAPEPAPPVA